MRRREDAILLGVGTTRRKFYTTDSNPGEVYVKVPAMRYVANASAKLCKGFVNHKCLFNKGDMLEILCPETVMEDGHATFFIHRAWNGKDMLMQRYLNDYISKLEFKGECVLEFRVTQVGHFSYGSYEECVCIQPVPGMNLWVDRRLTLQPESTVTKKQQQEKEEKEEKEDKENTTKSLPADSGLNTYDDENELWGYDYYCDPFSSNNDDNEFL